MPHQRTMIAVRPAAAATAYDTSPRMKTAELASFAGLSSINQPGSKPCHDSTITI